jgi:TolB-like protein/tetratricopeptide (TPR) repeat protein
MTEPSTPLPEESDVARIKVPSSPPERMIAQGGTPVAEAPTAAARAPTNLWVRLWQHKVLQWSLAYLGAAIAIAHGQELVAEAFEWPHLIGRILIGLLVVGLPIVITLAWYHGHKGLKQIGAGELGIIAVLVVIAAGLLVVFVRAPGEPTQARVEQTSHQDISQFSRTATTVPVGVSIAVLPFIDMSPEHNQDYFSDGLSEELLNQLAQIKGLRVTGRTSSFSFKGKNEDLRVIGEKLGVDHLLEGSVRKDGNQLRITAQLINAVDGTHLWSQTYDRELSGIFALQEDIAKDVSQALSITLDVGELPRAKGGTTNVDAYDKFLQATKLAETDGYANLRQAAQLFREAVALDPNFSRAWAGLYATLNLSTVFFPDENAALRSELDAIAMQAEHLPQDTSPVQLIRARSATDHHAWGSAQHAYEAALRLAPPSDPLVPLAYSQFLGATGRVREAIRYAERSRTQDPLNRGASLWLQLAYGFGGHADLADAEYERSKPFPGDHQVNDYHALMRLLRGNADPKRIDAQFAQYHSKDFNAMPLTRYLMAHWRDRADSLKEVRKAYQDPADHTVVRLELIAEFADYYGDKDLALAALRNQYVDASDVTLMFMWSPYATSLRTDARFKQMLRDLGLANYFLSSGHWGDFCKPLGKDDFECH